MRTPCGARSTASTPSCISRRASASASRCTRSRSTRRRTASARRCCSRRSRERPVRKLVVASSMSIYGEGLYSDASGRRGRAAGANAGAARARASGSYPGLEPVPTPETKRPGLSSIYALTKYDQERACLVAGRRVRDPDGGAAALQHVRPAAGALESVHRRARDLRVAAAERAAAAHLRGRAAAARLRLGARRRARVRARARARRRGRSRRERRQRAERQRARARAAARCVVGRELEPEITGESRVGDIRHCFADVGSRRRSSAIRRRSSSPTGMSELAAWLEGQTAEDRVDDATAELARRGLAG